MNRKDKLKVMELFGGIGACSAALKRNDIDFEIVDYVEIDKYATASYNAINGTNFETQDIQEWDKDIKADLIMHGSPCQDFSIAGLQNGGDEGSNTRSSLMYETLRIVEKIRPTYVIWENVKNLLSKNHKHNFDKYIEFMEKLGYTNTYNVLNAKDYGIPQNRERIFVISILNNDIEFNFPGKQELDKTVFDLLEDRVDDKFYLTEEQLERIKNTTYNSSKARLKNKEIMRTLCARDYKDPQIVNLNIVGDFRYDEGFRVRDKVAPCITAGTVMGKTLSSTPLIKKCATGFRKLTPLEYWRLMGFTDEEFNKADKVCSNPQLYKQAGNSIVVNVLQAVIYNLLIKE